MTNYKFFKLHASCVIVKGKSNGAIYDLRRGVLYNFPNEFLDIIESYENQGLALLKKDYEEQLDVLNQYFDFLIENELIFFTDNLSLFPKISTTLTKPYLLDIVLLEIDVFDEAKLSLFRDGEISQLGCKELVLISTKNTIESLIQILSYLDLSKVQTVTYLIDSKDLDLDQLRGICDQFLRLREVIVYNSKSNSKDELYANIYFVKENLQELLSKRVKDQNDLVPNLEAYVESISYNLFFNRRLYIDNDNNLKHSFEEKNSYGTLGVVPVNEVVATDDFTRLWKIKKDDIIGCLDCELRYICPDNRIPIQNEENGLYYHLEQCNYNPYTNEWK